MNTRSLNRRRRCLTRTPIIKFPGQEAYSAAAGN